MVPILLCLLPHNAQQQHSVIEIHSNHAWSYVHWHIANNSDGYFLQLVLKWRKITFLAIHHCLSYYSMLGLFLTTTGVWKTP